MRGVGWRDVCTVIGQLYGCRLRACLRKACLKGYTHALHTLAPQHNQGIVSTYRATMLYIDEYMYRSYTFILSFAWIRAIRASGRSRARGSIPHTRSHRPRHTHANKTFNNLPCRAAKVSCRRTTGCLRSILISRTQNLTASSIGRAWHRRSPDHRVRLWAVVAEVSWRGSRHLQKWKGLRLHSSSLSSPAAARLQRLTSPYTHWIR